jgi:hypothetical protein
MKFTTYQADVFLQSKVLMTEQGVAHQKAYVAIRVGNNQRHSLTPAPCHNSP